MSQVYFTSDLHLCHKNILKYRPHFNSIQDHDDTILTNIFNLSKRSVLFILGDFIFKSPNYEHYVNLIKKNYRGQLKIVMGNHDSTQLYKDFDVQLPLLSYKNMWLSHCPIHPNELRNRIGNIHGHLHLEKLNDSRYFNVNTDVNNYTPVPLELIKEHFTKGL